MRYNAQDGSHFRCIVSFSDHNQPFCFFSKESCRIFRHLNAINKAWSMEIYVRRTRRLRTTTAQATTPSSAPEYVCTTCALQCSGRHRPKRTECRVQWPSSTQKVLSLQCLRPIDPGGAVITGRSLAFLDSVSEPASNRPRKCCHYMTSWIMRCCFSIHRCGVCARPLGTTSRIIVVSFATLSCVGSTSCGGLRSVNGFRGDFAMHYICV